MYWKHVRMEGHWHSYSSGKSVHILLVTLFTNSWPRGTDNLDHQFTHNCPLNSWTTIRLQIPRRKYQVSYLNYQHLEQPFKHNEMKESQNIILVQYLWIPTTNVTCWQMNYVAEVRTENLQKSNVDSFPLLFFLPPKSCVIFQPLTLNFIWLWGLPNSHQGSSL